MGIATFLGGLFSSSKIQDTAIDAVRKLGGLDDMNGKDKAQFLLDYMDKTKHQSETRRFIAIVLVGLYGLLCLAWLAGSVAGYAFGFAGGVEFAKQVIEFMAEIILTPFNLIMSFYFVINMVAKLGKS